jgi:hypothetical protein
MVKTPILVFTYWEKKFHGHVDSSAIELGAIQVQPWTRELDHPITFSSRKMSELEEN